MITLDSGAVLLPVNNITPTTGCFNMPLFVTQLSYLWNFTNEPTSDDNMYKSIPTKYSPKFSNDRKVYKCFLSLENQRYSYHSDLSLNFEPAWNHSDVIIIVTTSMINDAGEPTKTAEKTFRSSKELKTILVNRFYKVESNLIVNGQSTIKCDISLIYINRKEIPSEAAPLCALSHDLNKAMNDTTYSDVTLNVGGESIKAHKFILASRSSAFAAMFEPKVNKKVQDQFNITGVEPAIMKELVGFLYTGKTPNIKQMAKDLLVAADTFKLNDLKTICENELISGGCTTDNVVDILIAADQYDAQDLKAVAIQFINKNAEQVMSSSDWKALVESHPDLIEETYRALLAKTKLWIDPTTVGWDELV